VKADKFHARLITLKNTPYAGRQMLSFLALLPKDELSEFLQWAEQHLGKQSKSLGTKPTRSPPGRGTANFGTA